MSWDNHGLRGHSFQPSVQMEIGNHAESSAWICLRKIAFGSESPVPQPEWARGRRSGHKSRAPKQSRLPHHSSIKRFPWRSVKSAGKPATITKTKPVGAGWRRLDRGGWRSGGAEGRLFSAKTPARSPSTATQKEGWRPAREDRPNDGHTFPIGTVEHRRGLRLPSALP
jgi:hypothetical protein